MVKNKKHFIYYVFEKVMKKAGFPLKILIVDLFF